MNLLISFATGLIFGLGLLVSGMSDPSKVLAFLDLAGAWDPSLMLVMGGAIGIAFFAFRFAGKRPLSLLGDKMHLPTATRIDRPLILGSLIFGVGWGLAGICPGPAFVLLGRGSAPALIFAVALLAGMVLVEVCQRFLANRH